MFRLPPSVVNRIGEFKEALKELVEGRMSPDRFKGIRVPWGIYSQRGGKVFMTRIRVPAGVISPSQLKALAHCSLRYGNGVLHVTTRQDIQIHEVKIERTGEIMDYLREFDLSPRGGGGNTVRNVTACPFAGICPKERFDVRGYAIALTEFLLKDPNSYRLPRKFKIAFSGCSEDCALATVADLGFVARDEGFSVYAGGGLGAVSKVGQLLEEVVPTRDVGYVAEAAKRVFFKHGERRDRRRARLRFLIERIGFDEFKRLFREELDRLRETTHIALRRVEFTYPPEEDLDLKVPEEDEDFKRFASHNLFTQRQRGYFALGLRLPLGDIPAEKAIELSEVCEGLRYVELRTSQNQNIYICNLRADEVYGLYLKLRELGLARPFISTVLDPVSCQGAATCNLGLCNSKALAARLIEELRSDGIDPGLLKGINIKISGCPNSCGHHPIGTIGLHGLVRKVGLKPVPFYKVLLGGVVKEGETQLGEAVGIVPARNVPHLLKEFLGTAQREIEGYGDVHGFLQERGRELMEELIERYAYVPSYEEDRTFYRDWGKEEDFSLAGIGPGECGAGVLDMIEADIQEAKSKLSLAEENYDPKLISEAMHISARALLVVRGIEPKSPIEAVESFLNEFVLTGIAAEKFEDLRERFLALQETGDQTGEEPFFYAKGLLEEVERLYSSMDSSFNFPRRDEVERPEESEVTEEIRLLDLRGTPCPINYVKAKLFLEGIEPGDVVDILLDDGEPIANVPPSLENDGHKILEMEELEKYHRVRVEKGGGG
jgi:sulfite reductase (ferredoxin)